MSSRLIFDNFDETANNLSDHPTEILRKAIAKWLSPLSFLQAHQNAKEPRCAGTGQWLLNSSKFKDWDSGIGRTLWCRGIGILGLPH